MIARLSFALCLLFSMIGCHSSDAVRNYHAAENGVPNPVWGGSSVGERLSYQPFSSQYGMSRNKFAADTSVGTGFDFLNPFRSRSKENDLYFRADNEAIAENMVAENMTAQQGEHATSAKNSPYNPIVNLAYSQNKPLTVRADDPPEIIDFARFINGADIYTHEQKEEVIELLRKETPAMRSSMIANVKAAVPNAKHGVANEYSAEHVDASAASSPITQVSQVMRIDSADTSQIRPASYAEDDASQDSFRLATENSVRNRSSLRLGRLSNELSTPPRIIADQALPSVAAPGDHSNIPDPQADAASSFQSGDFSPEETALSNALAGQDRQTESFADTQGLRQQDDIRFQTHGQSSNSQGLTADDGSSRARMSIVLDGTSTESPGEPRGFSEANHTRSGQNSFESPGNNEQLIASRESRPAQYDMKPDNAFYTDLRSTPRIVADNTPARDHDDWSEAAQQALESLTKELQQSATWEEQENLQAEINQRLLHLLLGNQREAVRPIPGLSPTLQDFWKNELLGLSTILDDDSIPNHSYRFAVAQHHLQAANLYLQDLCPIRVRNLNFINQCDGFGVYETASNEFLRGEPIFVYAEIDNLICKENDDHYVTQVSSSYEIVDVLGSVVTTGDFSKTRKDTKSRIRDAFLLWRVDLPRNIVPGKYFLKISVSDLNHPNHQFDQQSLEFNIATTLRNN